MKVLYIPNEWGSGRQSGMRRALATLVDHGLLEDVRVYSLLWRVREGEGRSALTGLLEAVKAYAPDLVLMQHLGGTGLDDDFFLKMRSLCNFALVYHEADPYSRWKHRLPREARAAGRSADVVYTVGSNVFRSNFERTGSTDVRWCSSVYDPGRFGKIDVPTAPIREFDVVMVANKTQARSPFSGHPNAGQRIELVKRLSKAFGSRFAVYGKGWTGVSAKGPVDYSRQFDAVHSGWITANWDHYANEDAYFSDRLPTTLAAGSVHISTHHKGFDTIFPDSNSFLRFGESPKAVVSIIEDLLSSQTHSDFINKAIEGQIYADRNLRQDDQLVKILNFDTVRVDPLQARNLWEPGSRMLAEL